jgi:hypothetical protein
MSGDIMIRIDKVRLGFSLSVIAFIMTIIVSGSPDFIEMNPILAILFNEFNNYHVIFIYAFMWAIIFTMYEVINDKVSGYYAEYAANIILLIGFFDLLHNVISIIKFYGL